MGNSTETRVVVDITEKFLERFELGPSVARVWLRDSKLPGFMVIVGKERVSFVVRAYVKGERRKRRLVTIGAWAPAKARAADAGLRDRTMTVAMARDAAIRELGAMRAGEDPAAEEGNAPAAGPTFGDALALHLDRLRRKGGRPRSIDTIEREVKKHLSDWTARPLADITRTDARERHESLTKGSGPYVANRCMRHLRAVWNTAEREHDLPRCPAVAVHWNKVSSDTKS